MRGPATIIALLTCSLVHGCGDDSQIPCPECEGGHSGGGGQPADGGAGGNPTNGGGGEGGTGGGGVCEPMDGAVIPADCGVFVKKDTNGAGTQDDPTGDVQAAIDLANQAGGAGRVYICGTDVFDGSISIPADMSIYGNIACTDWRYTVGVGRPTIQGEADKPAALIDQPGENRLLAIRIEAADAEEPSGSSIALLIESANVDIRDCDIWAKVGLSGLSGTNAPTTNTATGTPGNNGAGVLSCGMSGDNPGGMDAVTICGQAMSVGGAGGLSKPGVGGSGFGGITGTEGNPGMGEPASAGWTCTQGDGDAGSDGMRGVPGSAGVAKGTLLSTGYVGSSGAFGGDGLPGQGGGGGGAAKGSLSDCNPGVGGIQTQTGASGGSGGGGGCGGVGAAGGAYGGSSFGLVSLNATVTLVSSDLRSNTGGDGGNGGTSQPGASGGTRGTGGPGDGVDLKRGCDGGFGGNGGRGGGGGGGRGGHSAAIVFVGTIPTRGADVTVMAGDEGNGGTGVGNGMAGGNNGAQGTACDVMDFTGAVEVCER